MSFGLPLLLILSGAVGAGTVKTAPADTSILVIAGPDEPGERLIVTGRVLSPDGRTPAGGSRVGVYHTDASGVYGTHPTRARLSGWLTTDARGRFEIRTIRPGPYGRTPAHIHFIIGGNGGYELRFADDPLLRSGLPGGLEVQERPVQRDKAGVQHVTVEWRLPLHVRKWP